MFGQAAHVHKQPLWQMVLMLDTKALAASCLIAEHSLRGGDPAPFDLRHLLLLVDSVSKPWQ